MSKTDVSKLIKVDLGPYASRIYKFDLFSEGEYYMAGNDKLKFLHFNNDDKLLKMSNRQARLNRSRTVAVLALAPHTISKNAAAYAALTNGEQLFIPIAVGVATASLDDNYNRALGRDKSVKEMKEIDVQVIGISMNENHIFLHMEELDGVSISFRVNRKSGFSTVVGKMNGTK